MPNVFHYPLSPRLEAGAQYEIASSTKPPPCFHPRARSLGNKGGRVRVDPDLVREYILQILNIVVEWIIPSCLIHHLYVTAPPHHTPQTRLYRGGSGYHRPICSGTRRSLIGPTYVQESNISQPKFHKYLLNQNHIRYLSTYYAYVNNISSVMIQTCMHCWF